MHRLTGGTLSSILGAQEVFLMSREGFLSGCLLHVLASLYVLITPAAAQAQPQNLFTRHVRDVILNGEAQYAGRLPSTQTMLFDIVLALRHRPELDDFLQDLYDPSSPSYRRFLSPQEFTERFGPTQEEYDTVLRFAVASGFEVIGGSRDAMDVQLKGSVASVEKAFHVTMGVYQHPTENRTFFAPDREPTLDLPFRLWHISGLDNYSLPRPMFLHSEVKAQSTVAGSCPGGYYCGSDMRAAYYGGTVTGTGQDIALLELAGTDLADLDTYYSATGQTKPYTPTLVSTGGYSTSCFYSKGCDDTEQTLDMTQAMSMAPGSKMLYMYVCGNGALFSETACLSAISTASPLSFQISSSWLWAPADPLTDDPYFEKFAAQGQNFFVASGDSGSYQSNPTGFDYPAEDNYVTAVGGTELQVTHAGGPWSLETAWADSGGGYSEDGAVVDPSWQQIGGVINNSNLGSKTYRNVPDVAAEADLDFYVCSNQSGCKGGFGGTSFAAPMWAGYMALVNQQAIANGNPSVGLVTPFLYNVGVGSDYDMDFHDITSGSNGPFYYPAVKGYDLVTGWGSPNGSGLINALSGTNGPSFMLAANPTNLGIDDWPPSQASGTTTITVYPLGGFKGAVTLSASGLPSGVTAAFVPNPATTTSALTVTVSTPHGATGGTVMIAGKSDSLTATTKVSLSVDAPTAPVATLTPTSLTFANTAVGASSAPKTVTLANIGSTAMNISNIAASGDFALKTSTKPCGATLAASATCIISVTFAPRALGKFTGNITITDNALNSPQTVALSGEGIEPAGLTPASTAYGTQAVGTTSAARTFTLTNNQPVSLTSVVISTTGDFSVSTTTCAKSLVANTKCTIGVVFKPTEGGTRAGQLSVSDSASNSPQTSTLKGTGK
jgi:subtilase family serine protease